MIAQIGSLVKGSPSVGVASALFYAVGASVGAALFGLALGALGLAIRWLLYLGHRADVAAVWLVVGLLAFVGGFHDLGIVRFPLPQVMKQVPRCWLSVFGPYRAGLLWGLAIGLAFWTKVQYSLYYVVALWILLAGQPLLGAAVLGTYGLAQGVLLTFEIVAVRLGFSHLDGLLGSERAAFFFPFGGALQLSYGAFLVLHSGLVWRLTG